MTHLDHLGAILLDPQAARIDVRANPTKGFLELLLHATISRRGLAAHAFRALCDIGDCNPTVIHVQNLTKSFHVHRKDPGFWPSVRSLFRRTQIEKKALRGVSLEVAEGEILGLVGPNGAGKTTLVKILAGIIHPTAGTAQVLGYEPWKRADEFRRQIALIMGQKAQLWWDLPAADSFLLLREIYRIPHAQFRETLDTLATMLNVTDELTVQLRRLSLGERMKMELIAALLHQPRIVFLDEPTIGLDLTAQRAIRDFLLAYRETHRPAMILTSHYMEDIERLCKRIVIIRDGTFVFDGPLRDVMDRYVKNKTVEARYRGSAPSDAKARLSALGTVEFIGEGRVRMCVPRDRVAVASAEILRTVDAIDLDIHEEDLGTVIERIFRDRRSDV